MPRSNDGARHGLDYESEWYDDVTNFTTPYSPNSIRMGRFMFISWKRADYPSDGSKILVQPSAWGLWLTWKRYPIPLKLLLTLQSTWQRRLKLLTGLRVSIDLDSVANGRICRITIVTKINGRYSTQHRLLMMSVATSLGGDIGWSILEQEK